MWRMPRVAAARAATSCRHLSSGDRRTGKGGFCCDDALVSHKNVLIRSFLLSQRGENRKLPNSVVFDATASVKTVCSSWAKRALFFSGSSSATGWLGFARGLVRVSSEIPKLPASASSVDGRQSL